MLADATRNPGDHNSFAYHPAQYVAQQQNNPGGVCNLAYANLSLPRGSAIGNGTMVDRMMRPCSPIHMQAGRAIITSTYGRQVTGFTSAPLYDRDTGSMGYGSGVIGDPQPFSGGFAVAHNSVVS